MGKFTQKEQNSNSQNSCSKIAAQKITKNKE
jgi:hypothetical protein